MTRGPEAIRRIHKKTSHPERVYFRRAAAGEEGTRSRMAVGDPGGSILFRVACVHIGEMYSSGWRMSI